MQTAQNEHKLKFEISQSKINLGFTVFIRKWAGILEEAARNDVEVVK
jgi:hypothetical protein